MSLVHGISNFLVTRKIRPGHHSRYYVSNSSPMCLSLFISTSKPNSQRSLLLDNSFLIGRLVTTLMALRIILLKPESVSCSSRFYTEHKPHTSSHGCKALYFKLLLPLQPLLQPLSWHGPCPADPGLLECLQLFTTSAPCPYTFAPPASTGFLFIPLVSDCKAIPGVLMTPTYLRCIWYSLPRPLVLLPSNSQTHSVIHSAGFSFNVFLLQGSAWRQWLCLICSPFYAQHVA